MNTFKDSQLSEIARNQKGILRLLLVSIPIVIGTPWVPATHVTIGLIGAAFILIGIMGAILIHHLARALEEPFPWLYVACAFLPYINTVTLLLVNAKATAALKARGIEVGLMGVNQSDLKRLRG